MKPTLTLGAVALLALSLSSCAASGDSDVTGTQDSAQPQTSGSTQDQASGAVDAVEARPLTAFLDELYGLDQSPDERAAHEVQVQRDVEDLVAACMRDAGFDYTPDTTPPRVTDPDRTADGVSTADQDDRAWVTVYGYGIVETPDRAAGAPPEHPVRTPGSDPNSLYVASLTDSERQAYQLALHGEQPTDAEADAAWDLSEAGCHGQATVEVRGADPRDSLEFTPFFEAVDEFYGVATTWEGAGELESEWAACMSTQGQAGFTLQSDGLNEIAVEHQALWAAANPGDVSAGVEQQAPPAAALEQLATKERELALVDLDCREQVDYRARATEIAVDAESRFMTDHAAAVSAIRAASEQQGR